MPIIGSKQEVQCVGDARVPGSGSIADDRHCNWWCHRQTCSVWPVRCNMPDWLGYLIIGLAYAFLGLICLSHFKYGA